MIFPWHKDSLDRLAAQTPRLAHALLICGREGIGKLHFALAFAAGLLCESPQAAGRSCGACPACRWFGQGSHPDFRLVQPDALAPEREGEDGEEGGEGKKKSQQIRIDQVRELQGFLAVGTHRGGRRVIVMHPADTMNPATQNALLKSLEEPTPGTLFLLVTSQPHRLLATVRSRCQAVMLAVPDRAVASKWLREQGASGGDALLAAAGGAPLAAMALAEVEQFRAHLIAHLKQPGFDPVALAESCKLMKPAWIVDWLQRWSFDLFSLLLGGPCRYHPPEEASLRDIAARCDEHGLSRFLRSLARARALSSHPLNAKLFFEDLFLQYLRLTAP